MVVPIEKLAGAGLGHLEEDGLEILGLGRLGEGLQMLPGDFEGIRLLSVVPQVELELAAIFGNQRELRQDQLPAPALGPFRRRTRMC